MSEPGPRRSRLDDRAVSTAVGYVLTLTITTVLISGLLIAGGSYVGDERERAVRSELTVIGQQVVGDLGTADGLVRASSASTALTFDRRYPERVAGSSYRIEIEDSSGADTYSVVLSATAPDVSVTVTVRSETPLSGSADGGAVRIRFDAENGLVISDD